MYVRELLLLTAVLILLVACGGGKSPVEVVQSFMSAIETIDIDKVQNLVCQTQRDKVRESLAPFVGGQPSEAFEVDLDDLTFQEKSNDGETAVVHVTGKLTISFLGQQETQEINEDHLLKKEKGRWLVCDP